MTDEAVVKEALVDPEQFAELVFRYEEKLRRYIRRLGVQSKEDQEDILQEIFIKAYRNLNDFDTTLSFSSWIYRIAHNETMSWYRRERARPTGHLIIEGEEVMALLAEDKDSPEETLAKDFDAVALSKYLDTLPPKYRDPLLLRYFEHKEYEEISDILEIPVGTVGTLIYRGKSQLKKMFTDEEVANQNKK